MCHNKFCYSVKKVVIAVVGSAKNTKTMLNFQYRLFTDRITRINYDMGYAHNITQTRSVVARWRCSCTAHFLDQRRLE